MEDYLDAAEELGHLTMFTLALTSGLREGELIALLWGDLDMKQKELTIQEERVVKNGKPVVYGERKRVVPLNHQVVKLLEEEHQKHPSNPWMFPHPGTGKPYSRTIIRRLHDKILEKAGIDHIRMEDLRHTLVLRSRAALQICPIREEKVSRTVSNRAIQSSALRTWAVSVGIFKSGRFRRLFSGS